eukprot:3940607-Rhodomonas_salina.1
MHENTRVLCAVLRQGVSVQCDCSTDRACATAGAKRTMGRMGCAVLWQGVLRQGRSVRHACAMGCAVLRRMLHTCAMGSGRMLQACAMGCAVLRQRVRHACAMGCAGCAVLRQRVLRQGRTSVCKKASPSSSAPR